MVTLNQLVKNPRKFPKKKRRGRTPFLKKCPQKRGICVRVYTTKPKKPHSAIRKLAKVQLPSTKRHVLAYIPGQGHNSSAHSVVLLRGGRVRDVPGMQAKIIRNKLDFMHMESFIRKRRRSKYGLMHLTLDLAVM